MTKERNYRAAAGGASGGVIGGALGRPRHRRAGHTRAGPFHRGRPDHGRAGGSGVGGVDRLDRRRAHRHGSSGIRSKARNQGPASRKRHILLSVHFGQPRVEEEGQGPARIGGRRGYSGSKGEAKAA